MDGSGIDTTMRMGFEDAKADGSGNRGFGKKCILQEREKGRGVVK